MDNKSRDVPETLSEIIGVAIEYDLHLEPNRFINYMDLYCSYLLTRRASTAAVTGVTANFYQFICSQSLLNITVSATESETGETIVAPRALQHQTTWEAGSNVVPLNSVTRH